MERGNREVVTFGGQRMPAPDFPTPASASWSSRSAPATAILATIVGAHAAMIPLSALIWCCWEKASNAVRTRLAAEHPQASSTIEGIVAEVVGGIRTEARNASPDFAAAQAAVERQNRLRRIGKAEIYQYARDRKIRGDRDRAVAVVRYADRRGRAEHCSKSRRGDRTTFSLRSPGCRRPQPRPFSCCVRPTAACRPKISIRR